MSKSNEIVTVRTFPVPRWELWKLWSNPEILAKWWGPKGFTNEFHTFEFRNGGDWKLTMRGPDGTEFPNTMLFGEILEFDSISVIHSGQPHFRAEVSFRDAGHGTEITFRMIFASPEIRDEVAKIAVHSNEEMFDRLEMFC